MLGESLSLIESYRQELIELQDERNLFVLANEDTMNEWAYEKKLKEYDERIEKLNRSLEAEKAWYEDCLENDPDRQRAMEEFDQAYDDYKRQKWFEDLAN